MSLTTSVRTFGRPLITFRRQFSNTIVKVNICGIWELKFSDKMASKLILTLFFTLKHWRKMFYLGSFLITHEMSEKNIQIIFSSHCSKPYFFTRMSNKKPRDFYLEIFLRHWKKNYDDQKIHIIIFLVKIQKLVYILIQYNILLWIIYPALYIYFY